MVKNIITYFDIFWPYLRENKRKKYTYLWQINFKKYLLFSKLLNNIIKLAEYRIYIL